jgi:pilus assembly protein CpaB
VHVDDVVGVAGFINPGSKVDILISGTPPKGTGGVGTMTKTLLQDVEVLSAGQNIARDSEGKPISVNVVNMLVTPEQAEILSLASNEMRIQLVLRNPTDAEVAQTNGTAVQYLFDNHGKGPVADAPKPVSSAPRPAPKALPPPPPPPAIAVAPPPPPKPEPIRVIVFQGSKRSEATFEQKEEGDSGGKKE